jgi:hypothetical protein
MAGHGHATVPSIRWLSEHRACAVLDIVLKEIKLLKRLPFVVAAWLWVTPALAAPIVFSDRGAFDAAIGPHTTITFDTPLSCNVLRVQSGTCLADAGAAIFEFESFFYGSTFVDTVPIVDWSAGMHFDTHPRAVGFDLIGLSDQPYFITIATANSPLLLTSYVFSGNAFFGLLLDQGEILGLSLNPYGPLSAGGAPAPFEIDNVRVTPVPEPGTGLLLGVVVVGLLARKRVRSGD